MLALVLEGIWLCYYQATRKLDDVCYEILRKLEESLGIQVHGYLKKYQERSFLVRSRKYIWFVAFMALWFMGMIVFV